jgi:hypothetical protein
MRGDMLWLRDERNRHAITNGVSPALHSPLAKCRPNYRAEADCASSLARLKRRIEDRVSPYKTLQALARRKSRAGGRYDKVCNIVPPHGRFDFQFIAR